MAGQSKRVIRVATAELSGKGVKRPVGRPTLYGKRLAERICDEIATTTRGLDRICEENPDFPEPRTIYRWLRANEEFRQLYAHAREEQKWILADQIIEITDTPKLGIKTKTGKDGVEITESDMLEHRKLQIETRKWMLSKLDPMKWGKQPEVANTAVNPQLEALFGALQAGPVLKDET